MRALCILALVPYHFLLDTGSTHSAIAEAIATDLNAPVVAKAVVGSAVGGRAGRDGR